MSPSRDPFGFTANRPTKSTDPIIVVAQPGQEVRIVVPDNGGPGMDTGGVGRNSVDSRQSANPSTDSRQSANPSTDNRAALAQGPFAFTNYRRGFSPTPITIIASSGQEIRIVVPNESGSFQALIQGASGDSRASPSPKSDG